ncbi:hypothetical protein [Clostridium estertheticum]|uniref:hypothetical protein n=1 Tax=Clostridium estertheticum TaxID=238834 RepID=UPI001C6E80D9|nr:hypothetical protein [Clostridium estertheticum]MBW9154831.1 hypothetical protein [Clostridium estertheticum]WLC85813.1 hypothetical protein KTC97_08745 [Clostridium estertheticum]
MKGGDRISEKVISIDKYKIIKSRNSKDVTENMLDVLGISLNKEELFIKLRKEKRREKDINGIGK